MSVPEYLCTRAHIFELSTEQLHQEFLHTRAASLPNHQLAYDFDIELGHFPQTADSQWQCRELSPDPNDIICYTQPVAEDNPDCFRWSNTPCPKQQSSMPELLLMPSPILAKDIAQACENMKIKI